MTPLQVAAGRDGFTLFGYTDRLTAEAGDTIRVYVQADDVYAASLVRLDTPGGDPVEIAEIGKFGASSQISFPGSYVRVAHHAALNSNEGLTIDVRIFATTPELERAQGLVTNLGAAGGWALVLRDGRLVLHLRDDQGRDFELASEGRIRRGAWYRVIAGFSPESGLAYVAVFALRSGDGEMPVAVSEIGSLARVGDNDAPLLIGAQEEVRDEGGATGCFNGKLGNPSLFAGVVADPQALTKDAALTGDPVAAWDFSQDIEGDDVVDTSSNRLHGKTVNAPMRAVTGASWRAQEPCFANALSEYGAIHFHDDDLDDARWEESFTVRLSETLGSGAYAVRLRSETAEDRMPLFVAPEAPVGRIAFLAPVYTYLAYGNEHLWQRQRLHGMDGPSWRVERAEHPGAVDRFVVEHSELGRSIYDLHSDGSGVCYSSRLRPILNLRDDYTMWLSKAPRHFAADLMLLKWLRRRDHEYDVITDETLHQRGPASIASYAVVVTGSHPEYWSRQMLDAMQEYLDGGGRLMYLGGNGFYWVTSVDPARPHLIEVRRGNAGTRNWSSAPGECFHNTTGELGGLWRHRGRPPQELVGVGFTALGYRRAAGYARTPASRSPEYAFVFEGVDNDVVGEFGLSLDGAAGDELDRHDPALGSLPGSVVLATSSLRHDASYQLCVEEIPQTTPDRDGEHDPRVRADMVYVPLPREGAVFSVGSINWIASLACDDGENEIARITENVLRRFAAP